MPRRSFAATRGGKPLKLYSAAEADSIIKAPTGKISYGVLAQIKHKQGIDLDTAGCKTPKTLVTVIKVMKNTRHASITDFFVKFFLEDKVDTAWEVGTLHGQTIDRQTLGSSEPVYMTELLSWNSKRPLCHAVKNDADVDEVQTIMRYVFDNQGVPRAEYGNRPLGHATLHFIAEFEISNEFRGPGLAQLAMKAYHEAIQKLSGGHAFRGTVVLSPAALRGAFVAKAGWARPTKSYVEVEHALIDSYRKSGYKVWTKADDALEGCGITIMGRTIGELSSHGEDTAAEPEFPPFVKVDCHAPAKDGQRVAVIQNQESATAKKLISGGVIRRETDVKQQQASRKRKAPEEAPNDMDSRCAKRRYYSPSDSRSISECGLKTWSSKCKLCSEIGGGRWHAWDCDVWTTA